MGVTPDERRELLGAWALDALDADEAAAVETWLATDPGAAREADRLRRAASWLGATEALAPPARLRESILARASERPTSTDPQLATYRAECARFDTLVRDLPDDVVDRPTFNGLTVRELIVHLASMETAVAETVGAPSPIEGPTGIEARTRVFVEALQDRTIDDVRRIWRDAASAIEAWAAAGGRHAGYPWWGIEVRREDVLVGLSFEIWTHADDIRRALGRALEPPAPPAIAEMASLSVHVLPSCLASRGRQHPERTARLVLTGDGGGDWLVQLVAGGEVRPATGDDLADVTIRADVVDWCHVVGERLEPRSLVAEVQGDTALADDVMECASAFATL